MYSVGLLPGIAVWGTLMLKTGLRAGGIGAPGNPFPPALEAALSFVGLMHAYAWTSGDTVVALGLGTVASWAAAYLLAGAFLLVVPFVSSEAETGH